MPRPWRRHNADTAPAGSHANFRSIALLGGWIVALTGEVTGLVNLTGTLVLTRLGHARALTDSARLPAVCSRKRDVGARRY
jgi:hypothetical protein